MADPEVFAVSTVDPRIVDTLADVAETLMHRERPLAGALRRMGETLGADGWPLARIHGWVTVMGRSVPRRSRARLTGVEPIGHLARGWADQHVRGAYSATCIDPITGLATPLVLSVRLQETIAHCNSIGVDPVHEYVLLVADLDVAAMPLRERDAVLITVAALLSGMFDLDETVARCDGRFVVLTERAVVDEQLLEQLTGHLQLLAASAQPFVWTDMMPADTRQVDDWMQALSGSIAA